MLRRGTVVLLLVGFLAVAAVGGAMAWLHGGFGGGDRGSAERGEGYAGESASDHRSVTNQWSWASAALWMNTMRSSAMPAARAASYEHKITAAAWSTSMFEHIRFGYGKHTMRLSGDTVRMSAAEYAVRDHACGFSEAT